MGLELGKLENVRASATLSLAMLFTLVKMLFVFLVHTGEEPHFSDFTFLYNHCTYESLIPPPKHISASWHASLEG